MTLYKTQSASHPKHQSLVAKIQQRNKKAERAAKRKAWKIQRLLSQDSDISLEDDDLDNLAAEDLWVILKDVLKHRKMTEL